MLGNIDEKHNRNTIEKQGNGTIKEKTKFKIEVFKLIIYILII